MNIHRITTAGAAGLAAVVLMGVGAGAASAATSTCPNGGTGPAATLSQEHHDAFYAEMTKLKTERDAIWAKYGFKPGKKMTRTRSTAMAEELAGWRVKRDSLFAKYGLTPPVGTGLGTGAGTGAGAGGGNGTRGSNGAAIHR
jgi:hypothetical protein